MSAVYLDWELFLGAVIMEGVRGGSAGRAIQLEMNAGWRRPFLLRVGVREEERLYCRVLNVHV